MGFKPQLVLKEISDPSRFGVAELDEDEYLINVIEKPRNPPSNLAVTGVYYYDSSVFGIIRFLEPSDRNELEITDVNNELIKRHGFIDYSILKGWWTDAGTPESYYEANRLIRGDK